MEKNELLKNIFIATKRGKVLSFLESTTFLAICMFTAFFSPLYLAHITGIPTWVYILGALLFATLSTLFILLKPPDSFFSWRFYKPTDANIRKYKQEETAEITAEIDREKLRIVKLQRKLDEIERISLRIFEPA